MNFSCRYRQILEKAVQFSGAEQLEALKAFVEASKCILYFCFVTSDSSFSGIFVTQCQ